MEREHGKHVDGTFLLFFTGKWQAKGMHGVFFLRESPDLEAISDGGFC